MSYRVTNSMMQQMMLSDMHSNMNKMLKYQEQITSQRKYLRPSENPTAVTRAMGIDTSLVENEQYQANLRDAQSWLKFSDQALGHMTGIFQRMRELTIYAGNGALDGTDMQAIATELNELKEELRVAANASMEGRYLFGGLKTGDAPFGLGANGEVVYNGNDYNMLWEFERFLTGQVSSTGRDVFPVNEKQNILKGIELPLDFEWKGRDEILEFKVGWRTVKVRIPERWKDEIRDTTADPTDYNRFRDPKELDGYSLQEIAKLINESMEMGDSGRLVNCKVVTDNTRNVQWLEIQSHTGEPVRLTSWPETDKQELAQGVHGAAYGPQGRVAGTDGKFGVRFNDQLYTVDVLAGESLADIATKLNSIPGGRIWASVKVDNSAVPAAEWLDVVSRDPGEKFTLEATGGGTSFFAPQSVTQSSRTHQGQQVLNSFGFGAGAPFVATSIGDFSLKIGNNNYSIPMNIGNTAADLAAAINGLAIGVTASIGANGELSLSSPNPFDITATGGVLPLFDSGVSARSSELSGGTAKLSTEKVSPSFVLNGEGALSVEYGGQQYWLDLAGATSLADVAAAINGLSGSLPAGNGLNAVVKTGLDADGNPVEWLEISANGTFRVSGFGSGADVLGREVTGSDFIQKNTDHSHIDFADFMGMETSLKSTELRLDNAWDTTLSNNAVDIKLVSGSNRGEIFINDTANLTLEELAARINGVCGDWLEAIVQTDVADGTNSADPLNNSGDNEEKGTQRLVLRTKDGAPVAVYDGPGKQTALGPVSAGSYAAELGLSTALKGTTTGPINYPSDGAGIFDENMPALLEVQVGNRTYTVKVCKNNCPTAESVAAAIVDQVNQQYGGKLLAVDNLNMDPTNPVLTDFALYSLTGEPLRVVDTGYGDPRFSDYTGGVAMQLGIQSGVLSAAGTLDNQLAATDGSIRIRTPGHTVDVPVLAGDTLFEISKRIREYTGSWLDVSFTDSTMDAAGGTVQLSLSAKDGSAVSVYDILGTNASDFVFDTGIKGTTDMNGWVPVVGDTMTISVNGFEHTIDLWDDQTPGGRPVVWNVDELAEMINTRFQGQDIRAEVVVHKDNTGAVISKELALWSPKGYAITVDTSSMTTSPFAAPVVTTPNRGGAGPFNQQVTQRTASNQKDVDFFGVIDNLISAVTAEDRDGITDSLIGKLDNWFSTLQKTRAQVGALTNRYETSTTRMISNNTSLTELNGEVIGIDLAEASMNYEMMSAVYEASLAMMARVVQPTLLDFLR